MKDKSFQSILLKLQSFWADYGCVLLQPYDLEMGAGTFHPATTLRCLGEKPWNAAYVQPCRRPKDGRYGDNPNRVQHYYQYQVILKPAPENPQELYLESLKAMGLDIQNHDIRFVEDNWESPTLGAAGLGWEVWCDGMEVTQFTYFQQMGGIPCNPASAELTYGLERLACQIQQVDTIFDIEWNGEMDYKRLTYGDIFKVSEYEFSKYNFELSNPDMLLRHFMDAETMCKELLEHKVVFPAYEQCIKASHTFNLLDARGVISVVERAQYIGRVRALAKKCCELWMELGY
jgi:glycyl-tRNA synthetase alpha chain